MSKNPWEFHPPSRYTWNPRGFCLFVCPEQKTQRTLQKGTATLFRTQSLKCLYLTFRKIFGSSVANSITTTQILLVIGVMFPEGRVFWGPKAIIITQKSKMFGSSFASPLSLTFMTSFAANLAIEFERLIGAFWSYPKDQLGPSTKGGCMGPQNTQFWGVRIPMVDENSLGVCLVCFLHSR